MRIKMLTSIAGGELTARPGAVVECPSGLAKRLIASGQAEPAKGQPVEAAMGAGAETATAPRSRGRGRRG